MTVAVWLAVLPVLAWAVMRTFGLVDAGRIPLFLLALTPWAAVCAVVVSLAAAALRRWVPAGLALLAVVAFALAIVPRVVDDGDRAPSGADRLTVMSLNMDDGDASPEAIVRLVRRHRVDVLVLLEAGSAVERLDAVGMDRLLPRTVSRRSRAGGSAVLADRRFSLLPRPQLGRLGPAPSLRLRVGDRPVDVTAIHPPHPSSTEWEREWHQTFESLPTPGAGRPPQVVLGDFNGTLDQPDLQRVLDRGYRDAAAATGAGLRMTWPADRAVPPFVAIDHVLAGTGWLVTDFTTARVEGSDHRAVIATLALGS